jgi:hypothetical protein
MIRESDYNFLLSSEQFCNTINKYSSVLDVNEDDLHAYQEDNRLLIYVFHNAGKYPSYAESFLRYKTQKMRSSYMLLASACRNSYNYNLSIGKELGLEATAEIFSYN